jgi:hypothetical protein
MDCLHLMEFFEFALLGFDGGDFNLFLICVDDCLIFFFEKKKDYQMNEHLLIWKKHAKNSK